MKKDCILAKLGMEYLNLTVMITARTMMMTRKTPTMRLTMRVRCLLALEGAALTGALVTVLVVIVDVAVVFFVVAVVALEVVFDVVAGISVDVEDV